jgi:hypothetical protein
MRTQRLPSISLTLRICGESGFYDHPLLRRGSSLSDRDFFLQLHNRFIFFSNESIKKNQIQFLQNMIRTTLNTHASKQETDDATDYGYGDAQPATVDYGYGDAQPEAVDYGYGDVQNDNVVDYGYGAEADDVNKQTSKDNQTTEDYGYGDPADAGNGGQSQPEQPQQPRARPRRRNSTVVRREPDNPLAVAEFLMGGPPPMSDRDMQVDVTQISI